MEGLREKLLQYPDINDNNVEEVLLALEKRATEKECLIGRGYSNAMAEKALDLQNHQRPPGWHSVFFYPDSNRPRNKILFTIAAGLLIFLWLK